MERGAPTQRDNRSATGFPMNTATSPPSAVQLLATEIAAYEREVTRMLAEGGEGRWVVIQGNDVIGVWDSLDDAVQAGDDRFGLLPFLVRQILQKRSIPRVGWGIKKV